MIPVFAMSRNARCLAEGFTERFKKLPRHVFALYRDPFHAEGERRSFVRVSVNDTECWADAITGALYDTKTGGCLSSSARIRV